MTPADWTELKALFSRALDVPAAERPRFIELHCPPSSDLRTELEALLEHHDASEGFLEGTVRDVAARIVATDTTPVPERIGSFRIVRELGRGGMGTVYLGERDDGGFEQHVAIKVIRRGMDTDEVRRRFLAERQILARLQHPNIARLLDGGITGDGSPYFVMEYIEGVPLTEHLRTARPGLVDRLRLFQTICLAVSYAHHNLVLHRDLKPGNIVITPTGTAKLMDFGVAKVLEGDNVASDLHTRADARYLTLAFASPEQIRGTSLTTASDVYSLGVLLFEMLTGTRPFTTSGVTAGEAERAILEDEPPRPSVAAAKEPADLAVPGAQLRGDLDMIVLMALRKEPERRYDSAERLSADVERYLRALPIQAQKDTVRYRLGKYVRRHRWGVAAGFAAAIGLAGALSVFAAQSVRIADERDKARQMSTLLVELLEGSDPGEALGDTLTARALLDRSSERIETDLAGQPELQAAMFDVVGGLYHSLGLPDRAEPALREALSLRLDLFGPEHTDVAHSYNALGGVLDALGSFDEAQSAFENALRIRRARYRAPHAAIAESLNDLGQLLLFARQDFDGAEPLLTEALEMRQALFAGANRDVAETTHNLALLDQLRGRYDAAAARYEESLAMRRELFGEAHPALVSTINNLALVRHAQGRYRDAEPLFNESLAMRQRLLGENHPQVAVALTNLGLLLRELGSFEEAERNLRRALTLSRTGFGERHPRTASVMSNLADVLRDAGSLSEAGEIYGQTLTIRREVLGPDHPHVAFSLNGLAEVARLSGRFAVADSLHRQALALRRARVGPDHPDVAQSLVGLARSQLAIGQNDSAEVNLEAALRVRTRALSEDHPSTAEVQRLLGVAWFRDGRMEEGERALRQAIEIYSGVFGADHWRTGEVELDLAEALVKAGRPDEAAALATSARSKLTGRTDATMRIRS